MFSKIWTDKYLNYSSSSKYDGKYHINTSKFNLFIGSNNSGKSRFLRALFIENEKLRGFPFHLESELKKVPDFRIVGSENYGGLKGSVLMSFLYSAPLPFSFYKKEYNNLVNIFQPNFFESIIWKKCSHTLHEEELKKIQKGIQLVFPEDPFTIKLRYYIPILRGMRPLKDNKELNYFKDRTETDYFPNSSNLPIITGLDLHKTLTQLLLGKPDGRNRVRQYEKILQDNFFKMEVTLIPEYEKDTVAVKLGEDDQFPIYDLGDGLQQAIIITSAVFFAPENSIFFIEEPENNMHPGLLRKLAEFLLDQDGHQYFITTHSNHLLDLAEIREDVFIHSFSKKDGSFFIQEFSGIKGILTDLGVRASSVYLANCTIWVEGITDRLYLRCYLKKYIETRENEEKKILEKYIENSHYAFIEYQGGNLTHWDFNDSVDSGNDKGLSALKTASNVFLIADGDIAGINKKDRKAILEKELGEENLHVFKGKEIENLLPEDVLKKTVEKFSIKSQGLDLSKIKEEEYKDSDEGIGLYLDRIFGTENWAAKSGTIKGKVDFCKKAVEVMKEDEWFLTSELEDLCKRIYNHIEKYNE